MGSVCTYDGKKSHEITQTLTMSLPQKPGLWRGGGDIEKKIKSHPARITSLCSLLSPLQRLLLVNNSERESGGAVNGSAGNDGQGESQSSPRALLFLPTQPPRIFSQVWSSRRVYT